MLYGSAIIISGDVVSAAAIRATIFVQIRHSTIRPYTTAHSFGTSAV